MSHNTKEIIPRYFSSNTCLTLNKLIIHKYIYSYKFSESNYKTTFKHKSVLVAVLKGSHKLFTVHMIYFSATASLLHKNPWYTMCLMPSFLQLLRWDLMPKREPFEITGGSYKPDALTATKPTVSKH